MAVTVDSFRGHFSEFGNDVSYPDSDITYWLELAGLLLNMSRWMRLFDTGTELFIAHNLVLEFIAKNESTNGGAPGITTGPINSKSIDKVSVGYDTNSGIEKDAGHWNNTIYGTRFIRLAKMVGVGPIQVGEPIWASDPLSSQGGWPGPLTTPGWFGS